MYPGSTDPALAVVTTPWSDERPRTGPFLVSLSLHALIVSSVFAAHYLRPPQPLQPVTAEQLLADDHYKLTWNYSRNDLPPVAPAEHSEPAPKKQAGDGARPRFKLPQRVVADDPAAASRRQMIWDQAPQVELTRDVRSPNFVEPSMPEVRQPRFEVAEDRLVTPARQPLPAENAPQIAANAPEAITTAPKLRYWEPERKTDAPAKQALPAENAPQLKTAPSTTNPAELQNAPKLRYWTPETEPAAPARRALTKEAAPSVKGGPGEGLDIGAFQKLSRLRYWTEEKGASEPGKQALEAGQVPQIGAAPAQGVDIEQFQRLSRLRYQDTEGAQNSGPAPARQALGESAPELGAAAAARPATGSAADLADAQALASLAAIAPPPGAEGSSTAPGRAVVGVDPDANASPADVPRGQRAGGFTAGPDGGANTAPGNSAVAEGGDSATLAHLRIPHLSVSPPTDGAGVSDGRQPGPSKDPETDRETLLRKFRNPNLSPVQTVGAVAPDRLTDAELPLLGRAVYTLAVNMPNISSFSGSWIIQFAEMKEDKKTPGTVIPPSPRLKVDPVYSRAAIDERVEGEVIVHAMIRSDGLVDNIKILKTLDDRLDESAMMALSKWRFNPATKDGVPIDVETVVHIPFRLVPLEDKKRR